MKNRLLFLKLVEVASCLWYFNSNHVDKKCQILNILETFYNVLERKESTHYGKNEISHYAKLTNK